MKKKTKDRIISMENTLAKTIETKIENKEPLREVNRVFNIYKQTCDKFGYVSEKHDEISAKYINYLKNRE
ncbi:MAG TPA: hypothetical protein VJ912_03910 [Candidatus Nanoarchaeia archaeon]|nr:hypothetical protein [Candidatus Nanoarchaeia archaeon]